MMRGYGIYVGLIFIVVGLVLGLGMSLYFLAGYREHMVTLPGALLGFVLFALCPFFAFFGVGTYLYFSGRREKQQLDHVTQQEYFLGVLKTQGKVSIGELMAKMNLSKEQVSSMVYELVHLGLFAGYIDWKQGLFFSKEVAVRDPSCLQCGATRELVGQGTWLCSHCGAQSFFPSQVNSIVS